MSSPPQPSLDQAGSAAERPPPTERPSARRNRSSLRLLTELSRERIALRHLDSWTELYKPHTLNRIAFSTDRPLPVPASCHDTGLAAFAQLATLRLGVRRAFVTILSRQTEYVLVESTRSMSLQSEFATDAKDKIWLGTSSFMRSDGINDVALEAWRKARRYRIHPNDRNHYYTEGMSEYFCIISDASRNPKFLERPLVSRADSLRFYFSVPLRDFDGTVLGSLTMLDDKPRYGVSANDMLFCEDLCDTIAHHVSGSTIASQRQRSERLIQALGTFNNGGSSLRDWWITQDNSGADRQRRRDESDTQQQARFNIEFGVGEDRTAGPTALSNFKQADTIGRVPNRTPRSASDGNKQAALDQVQNHIAPADFGDKAIEDIQAHPMPSKDCTKAGKDEFDAGQQVHHVYSRASNLLRESLGSAGVVFFDATAAASARPLRRPGLAKKGSNASMASTNTHLTSTSSDESKTPTNSDTDISDASEQRSKQCKVVGSSTQVQPSNSGNHRSPFQLSERDLAKMITSYPRGKVFAYTENGTIYSGTDESAGSDSTGSEARPTRATSTHKRHARILRKVVGDARSIAFFPIWDDTNERYRSCLFTWTVHANRFFDTSEDLTYLSAFSKSLRAEIARIETVASDIAKGKFISSVSHELRSPLHGVLAGVELLQDSQLTPFQEEMALSVAIAGRTLLDTVNHILDYSKISNLTNDQKKERARVDAARHKSADMNHQESQPGNMIDVDLARLTEEVAESVVSAFRYSQSFEASLPAIEHNGSTSRRGSLAQSEKGDVSVTLDIDKRSSWTTPMAPGSWTRVLTNIVGNALKYTPSGVISVRLFAKDGNSTSRGGVGMTYVTLQVKDTGIGMTNEFIANELFLPFRQADANSTGTGLGLSIVGEVAKEFNGSVAVESEPKKGTTVSVHFAARFTDHLAVEDDEADISSLSGPRQLCVLGMDDGSWQDGTGAVKDSVGRTASQWLGCQIMVSRGLTPPKAGAGLCVVSENDLTHLNSLGDGSVESLVSSLAASGSRLLVLGQSIASAQPAFKFEDFAVTPTYIHQPIGPRKLARVIANAKDSTVTREADEYALHNNSRKQSTSKVFRGNTLESKADGAGTVKSYFELPRVGEHQRSRKSNDLITPVSFMDASAVKTPEIPTETQRTAAGQSLGDTILLVEDNAINMRLLVALVKKQGLKYKCATNGLEALNVYSQAPLSFFLVLMDMNMPVMDGFESTAKIREFERKNKVRAANISALTGVTSEEARSDAFNAGVNKYLTKPIQMTNLKQLVAETRGLLEE